MSETKDVVRAHTSRYAVKDDHLVAVIDVASACAQVCMMCADACIAEEMVADLRRCIRLDLDCADVCSVTARMLSRQTEPNVALMRAQLEVCVQACRLCGDECASHAEMHEHCRLCSESCRRCEEACIRLLDVLTV